MRDADLRIAFRSYLEAEFEDDPATVVIDEMPIVSGEARADLAAVNGKIHGFELKSERDSLQRLPSQEQLYSRVFDRVTVVAASKHIAGIRKIVPKWWGIVEAKESGGQIELKRRRKPRQNKARCGLALAQLLWRSELVGLLDEWQVTPFKRSAPKRLLWRVAAEHVQVDEISSGVRRCIKARHAS